MNEVKETTKVKETTEVKEPDNDELALSSIHSTPSQHNINISNNNNSKRKRKYNKKHNSPACSVSYINRIPLIAESKSSHQKPKLQSMKQIR